MPTIYVLLCKNNRYYVGRTDRPLRDRIEEHFSRNGSEWTRRYKPIRVVETITDANEFDEDKYTKKYMREHGIERVRGGSYSQVQLPEYSLMALEKELCNASNLCFRCNRRGHFASNCYASSKADGSPIDDDDDSNDDDDEEWEELTTCYRCGRIGHYANQCYASTHVSGRRLH